MSQPPTPLRIPETMGPQEIGPYFRELREHFKLTPQDVSERLHIRVRYVTAMEEARFEALPGKVYARGYVHTYAEFLGLDADQVVAQCFPAGVVTAAVVTEEKPMAPEAAVAPKRPAAEFKPTPPPLLREKQARAGGQRKLVFAVLAVVALVLWQVLGGDDGAAPEQPETVSEIPESLLASVRSIIVPNAQNHTCLTGDLLLSCFYAGNGALAVGQLWAAGDVERAYLKGIDFELLTLPEPAALLAQPHDESDSHD